MQELFVEGGNRLCGELTIQGSKNGVLPVLAATIVCAGECRVENCPHLSDVDASIAILRGKKLTSPVCRGRLSVDESGMFIPASGVMGMCCGFDRDAIFTDLFGLIDEKAFRY